MKELAYSSTAAFLAHYRILSRAAAEPGGTFPLSTQDQAVLDAAREMMEALTPEERILVADAATGDEKCVPGEERRRRERAQLKLHRLLVAKGIMLA
jgi:hypothetical protein